MKTAVKTPKKWLALVLALAMCLSLAVLPASAEEAPVPISAPIATGTFENTSGDGGGNVVNLSTPRSFKAMVPVDMTEAQALEAAKTVPANTWTPGSTPTSTRAGRWTAGCAPTGPPSSSPT